MKKPLSIALLALSFTSFAKTNIKLDTIYNGVSKRGRDCLFRVNKYTGNMGDNTDGANDLYLYFDVKDSHRGSASSSVYGITLKDSEFVDVFQTDGNRQYNLKEYYTNEREWHHILIVEEKNKSKMFIKPFDKILWTDEYNSNFEVVLQFEDGDLLSASKVHRQETIFGFTRKTFNDVCYFQGTGE